jgi:hypothetical protein
MATKTLIVHGWSDCSESFVKLKDLLLKCGVGSVDTVYYADYESREDSLTFNDVVDGLNKCLKEEGFISENGEANCDLNVIVHSTGGLVIRHWINTYYANRIDKCPVKRIVMLAPANFGSPLAHRGKSFLGALVKGRWRVGDLLEVGRNILNGLELASPFQWDLAQRDLLCDNPYFNAANIQVTVLVGAKDYDGLRGWVNKPGTDGTVVISGTGLDVAQMTLDFCCSDGAPYHWEYKHGKNALAFGVLQDLDHGSIVEQLEDSANQVSSLVLEALTTKNFVQFQGKLEQITNQTYQATQKPRYQQFLLHCIDDLGASVTDFTVEFFVFKAKGKVDDSIVKRERLSNAESDLSDEINDAMLSEIHTHSIDPSYRRLLVDVDLLVNTLDKAKKELGGDVVLSMRVYVPQVDDGIRYDLACLENVVIYDPADNDTSRPSFFFPNTTTLVELKVNRDNDKVSVGLKPSRH